MTIYPYGKKQGLVFKWDIAAYDLPVPNRLIENEDTNEWSQYLDCLSPAQQLRKTAQATDQWLTLLDKAPKDPALLSEREQILLFSNWMGTTVAAVSVAKRLDFSLGEGRRQTEFLTDLDRCYFGIIDLLKAVNSPDVKAWEKRRERVAAHLNDDDGLMSKVITIGYKTFASSENAKKSPPPLEVPPIGLEKDVNVNKPLKVKPLSPK